MRPFSKVVALWENGWLKSNVMTMTYGLVSNRCVTLCRSVIMAAVVEPVGLKANWSSKARDALGFWKFG